MWLDRLSDWLEPFEVCFTHVAQRGAFRRYLLGLLSDSRRKSMEAMWARLSDPGTYQAFQHFITHAPWEADAVWTRLREVVPDRRGVLPFHSWFVGFVPKHAEKTADDPTGLKAVGREDSNLVVLAFAYDSRTKGNVATEIVKYYLQLHFGIKHDYRNFNLLQRGNFYQSN